MQRAYCKVGTFEKIVYSALDCGSSPIPGDVSVLPSEQNERDTTIGNVTEVVGRFDDRPSFSAAVEDLLAVGFGSSDLSVLDTHEALDASDPHKTAWGEALAESLGEKYLGPVTTAGLIMLAAGPVGAAIAGVIAAGLSGAAISDLLDSIKATPHSDAFARALENRAVLLWVRIDDWSQAGEVQTILSRHNAKDVHVHQRA